MTQDELKALVGQAAVEFVVSGQILGVGTGSTVNKFIDALAARRDHLAGAVSSSEETSARLRAIGIRVLDANDVQSIPVYIDGADEIDHSGHMIKGGGAALTREKIVADLAERFICIADESKLVDVLGAYPLPVEVIPMARGHVGRELRRLGGHPELREGFKTDNGNLVIDCRGLTILDPPRLEAELNNIAGVVTNGLFARRSADLLLLAEAGAVRAVVAPKA